MFKKERITKILNGIEKLLHKMIDERRDGSLNAFELILLSIDTMIKEYEMEKVLDKKAGNA